MHLNCATWSIIMKESGMISELTRLSEACAEGVAKELQPGLEPAALHVYVGIITC